MQKIQRLVLWVVLSGMLGGACLVSMLHFTGGALSMPLDDSYIFFQYAKRLVAGAPFSYQAGDPASTGLTSWLTLFVDAAGYAAGFRGTAMSLFAILVGWASLVWACVSLWRLGLRFHTKVPWAGPALLLATGPFVWASFSGMDFPLFMAISLAWAEAWPRSGERPGTRFFVLGSLLGLVRPDSVFLVGLGFLLAWRSRQRHWGWILPLAFCALPFFVQWMLTGSPESASMDVKSVLSKPDWTLTGWLTDGVGHWIYAVKGVFLGSALGNPEVMHANNGGGAALYWFPLALVFFLLGFAPAVWKECRNRDHGPATLLFGSVLVLLAAQCATVPVHWHWDRYLMTVSCLALPGIAWGLVRAGKGLEGLAQELRPGDGAGIMTWLAVLLSLPSVVYFVLAYGKNSADIYFQHIELAKKLNAASVINEDTVLGLHDAGALAYFGNYRVLDLEGLVTPLFQKAARGQAAGVWEALERLSPEELPDYLAVYRTWFSGDWLKPHKLMMSQRQFDSSIAAGNPLDVYQTDWSLLNSGATPGDPAPGCRLLGEVDVADGRSEQASGYGHSIKSGAYSDLLYFLANATGSVQADGGRLISGGEHFTIDTPVRGNLVMVTRSHAPFRIRVRINGTDDGVWRGDQPAGGVWVESSYRVSIPGGSAPRLEVKLSSDDPYHSAYGSFHYWVYQCP